MKIFKIIFVEIFLQALLIFAGVWPFIWLLMSIEKKATTQIIVSSILVLIVLIFYAIFIAIVIHKKRKAKTKKGPTKSYLKQGDVAHG